MRRLPLPAAAATLALTAAPAAAHSLSEAAPAPSSWWMVASAANLVMMVTFAAIAWHLWKAIRRGKQFRTNPLLTGFFLIFATCAVGHGLHFEHTLLPYYAPWLHHVALLGSGLPSSAAANFGLWSQVAMTAPTLVAVDVVTAGLGVWYFLLRKRQSRFFEGAELADDLETREREARAMHGRLIEDVTQALLLLEMGRREEAREVVDETLDGAQEIVDGLLEAATFDEAEPGDLVQETDPDPGLDGEPGAGST